MVAGFVVVLTASPPSCTGSSPSAPCPPTVSSRSHWQPRASRWLSLCDFTLLRPAGLALGLLLLALALALIATAEQVGAFLTAEAGAAGSVAALPAETAGTHDAPALAAMSTSSLTRQWETCGGDLDGVQLRADIIDGLEATGPVRRRTLGSRRCRCQSSELRPRRRTQRLSGSP